MSKTELTPYQILNLQERRQRAALKIAGYLGAIAGAVLLASTYTLLVPTFASQSILTTLSNWLPKSSFANSGELPLLEFLTSYMAYIVGIGGAITLAGGVSLKRKNRSTGRMLIWIGGAIGLFGLIFTIFEAYNYSPSLSLLTYHFEYWAGLVLSALAIYFAKRA